MSSRNRHRSRGLGVDGPTSGDSWAERAAQFQGEKAASFENPGRLLLERPSDSNERLLSLVGANTLVSAADRIFIDTQNPGESVGRVYKDRVANVTNSTGALHVLGICISFLKTHGYEIKEWLKTNRTSVRIKNAPVMSVQTFEAPNAKWQKLGTLESLPPFKVSEESGDTLAHFLVPLRDGEMKVGLVLDGITHTEHAKVDVLSSKDLVKIIEHELKWFETKRKVDITREKVGYFLLKIHQLLVDKGLAQGFFERATAGMFFHVGDRLIMVRAADTRWSVTTYDPEANDIVTLCPPPNHIERFDDPQVGHSQTAMLPNIPMELVDVLKLTALENVSKLVNAGAKYNPAKKNVGVAAFGHQGPIERFVEIDEVHLPLNRPIFVQLFSDGLSELAEVLGVPQPWLLGLSFSFNTLNSRMDPYQGRGKASALAESKVTGKKHLAPETFLARQLLVRPFVTAQLAALCLMMMGKVPAGMDYRFKRDDTALLVYRSEEMSIAAAQAFFKRLSADSAERRQIIRDYDSVLDGGWQRFLVLYKLLTGTTLDENHFTMLQVSDEPTVLDTNVNHFMIERFRNNPDFDSIEKLLKESLLGLREK